jgi:hypothetical protein
LTLNIGILCTEGALLLTDSAQSRIHPDGRVEILITRKTWKVHLAHQGGIRISGEIWVAPCASMKLPEIPLWFSDIRSFASFEQAVRAVADSLEAINTPGKPFSLLLAGGEDDQFPKLARIAGDGIDYAGLEIEYAGLGTIFFSTTFGVTKPPPHKIPSTFDGCRALSILLAATEIERLRGKVTVQGGPFVEWPLHVATWKWRSLLGGPPFSSQDAEVVEQAEADEAMLQYRTWETVDALQPTLTSDVYSGFKDSLIAPDKIAAVTSGYGGLKLVITPKPTSAPSAPETNTPSTDSAVEAPTETPPTATSPG